MRSVFITGTDTNAGKTFITAGILKEFVNDGINAVPAKPVQTGCVNDIADDLEFSLNTSGLSFSEETKSKLCPLRFAPACSPHLAAEMANCSINLSDIVTSLKDLQFHFECVIAEGAGGILVPIGKSKTMLDLMIELGWPVVLVSPDKLGTINHTLLSLTTLRAAGLDIAGVIINHTSPPSSLITASNTKAIREYGKVNILGKVPFSPHSFPAQSFTAICSELKGILTDELQGI